MGRHAEGTGRRSWIAAVVAVCVLATLTVSTGDARADGVTAPADPSIVQPMPAPGEVVAAGRVAVRAVLWAGAGVRSAELRVDGVVVAHRLEATGGSHRILGADIRLDHGRHRLEVRFEDGGGATVARGWWIAVSDLAIERLAGADRIATSVAVSRRSHPRSAAAAGAVLARMDDFPDALGGAPLAAQVGGPLLLSDRHVLPAATAQELQRVLVPGGEVHLLGGVAALSAQVERQVRALGFVPRRHAGADRYTTAVAVAELIPESTTAVVAPASSFPDALAASAPAARDGLPILLTGRDRLPADVRDLLADRDFDLVHVIGGPAVLSDRVLAEIDTLAGTVRRIAGATRYETATAVTARFYGSVDTIVVASGERFPDALTGGPHAAARGAPLLLSPSRRPAPGQIGAIGGDRPSQVVLLGGPAALDATLDADLRRIHVGSPDGPRELAVHPSPDSEVSGLGDLEVRFDRALEATDRTSVYVTLDGSEVSGRTEVTSGTLVFRPAGPPKPLVSGRVHVLRVVVAAYDGKAWRHLDHTLGLRGQTRTPPGLVLSLPEDGASGVASGERAVALTFDDGPTPAYTPQVLDVLDRYGATATFFVNGAQIERFPLLAREMAGRGHVLSNHTWSHRELPGLPASTFAAEVDPTTASIVHVTGRPVHCVRPPYGAYDREVVSRLAGRGLHTAMWTVDTRDWTRPGAAEIARRALDGLHPGAVILFHDGGGDRSQTVAALPRILEGIRAAGYRVAVFCG